MSLVTEVRRACAQVAASARHVRIDLEACAELAPAEPPTLDPERHYLEGDPADVADYVLALDALNFGSGWFPTLRKRELHGKPVSGYFTIAWNLADHVRTRPAERALALAGARYGDSRGPRPGSRRRADEPVCAGAA